jgi:hypothetical protein
MGLVTFGLTATAATYKLATAYMRGDPLGVYHSLAELIVYPAAFGLAAEMAAPILLQLLDYLQILPDVLKTRLVNNYLEHYLGITHVVTSYHLFSHVLAHVRSDKGRTLQKPKDLTDLIQRVLLNPHQYGVNEYIKASALTGVVWFLAGMPNDG